MASLSLLWKKQSDRPEQVKRVGRVRPRIAGSWGISIAPIRDCLFLNPETSLVVEWEQCWLDDQAIVSEAQWLGLLKAGRLADVLGAFALAWRQTPESLLLATDALGERSLFYAQHGPGLVFASSLELLLKSGLFESRLQPLALARYLTYAYVPGQETLFKGLLELEPGCLLRVSDSGLQKTAYWHLPGYQGAPVKTETEYKQDLRLGLVRAMHRRLPDGAIHASLSGGIDSSLVVALAKQLRPEVYTYSLSFGDAYRHELPFSQAVAEHCQTQHQVLTFAPQEILANLDRAMACLGNPIGDPLTVPNFLLFQEVSSRSSVLFNGEGGDPNFGGPKNLAMLLADLYSQEPEAKGVLEQIYLHSYRKCFSDLAEMLRPQLWQAIKGQLAAELSPWFRSDAYDSLINRLMAINVIFKGSHHILYKVNHLSEPFGVSPASPLFDRELTELAFGIPPELKLKGVCEKYILKEAVRDLLPDSIIDRPKSGMMVPVEHWFKPGGPLHKLAKKRLAQLEHWDIFEPAYLKRLMKWELGGYQPRHGAKVWILLALESWLRAYDAKL